MGTTTTYAWAPITKSVVQDDGTLMVYGPATDAGLDRDEQRMNQDWLDQAMPQWMAEGANVREQHDSKRAVGVGVGLTKDEGTGAHMLAACVVDPVTIKKALPGPNGRPPVLKGFSIGIKAPQVVMGKADAPKGEIVGGKIIEVSLVDRPSNPRATFTMVKSDGGDLEPVENPTIVESPDAGDTEGDELAEPDGMKLDEPDLAKVSALVERLISEAIERLTPAAVEQPQTTPSQGDSITKADLPDLIKAAVAEAIKPVEERAEELATQLGVLKTEMAAIPQPGGPVLTRVKPQDVKANSTHQLRTDAQELLAKAEKTDDPDLRTGYRQRARDLLAQADPA